MRLSKCRPFSTPPHRVQEIPSWLTSAWTDSIILVVESAAFQMSKGIKLFSQQTLGNANLARILSANQSSVQCAQVCKSFIEKLIDWTYLLLLFRPQLQFAPMFHPSRYVQYIQDFASGYELNLELGSSGYCGRNG